MLAEIPLCLCEELGAMCLGPVQSVLTGLRDFLEQPVELALRGRDQFWEPGEAVPFTLLELSFTLVERFFSLVYTVMARIETFLLTLELFSFSSLFDPFISKPYVLSIESILVVLTGLLILLELRSSSLQRCFAPVELFLARIELFLFTLKIVSFNFNL